jgi:hypothetical protein
MNSTYKNICICLSFAIIQLSVINIASAKPTGSINCSSISRGDRKYDQKLTIQNATLSNDGDGYNLALKIQGRGDTIKYKISSDLIVKGTDYSSNGGGELDSKFTIKKNGAFYFTDMPRSQKICEVKGTLNFGKGVKQKIFGGVN